MDKMIKCATAKPNWGGREMITDARMEGYLLIRILGVVAFLQYEGWFIIIIKWRCGIRSRTYL